MNLAKYAALEPRYPVSHRNKQPFSPQIKVPAGFSARVAALHRLDAELDRYFLDVRDYFEIVQEAYASNVHYSTSLEGNPLTLDEVRRFTRDSFQGKVSATPDVPRQEILNHLVTWLAPDEFRLPWQEPVIRMVHQFITEGVEADGIPGVYRTSMAPILNQDDDVVFAPAKPETIQLEVQSLLDWLNHQAPALHPVVAATVFFHEFESIHPFREGNGRSGRTLFHLYLQIQGLKNTRLCKLEENLLGTEEQKELYYRLLSWVDQEEDYAPLIDYVMDATILAYREAIDNVASKDLVSTKFDEQDKRILTKARHLKTWFSVADAAQWLDNRSPETVRAHLNGLVDVGALEDNGKATRGKRYRTNDVFAKLRENVQKIAKDLRSGAAHPDQTTLD